MREYVIKLTGEQFCTLICALEYTRDKYNLYKAEDFTKEVEDLRNDLYNQQQPQFHGKKITIYEGDLEEENRVLKGVIHLAMDYACRDKKLHKRIQDFNVRTNRHNGDNNVYLEDAVCFLTKLSKDARDDAKKWREFFEKVYQEQQAKESEKDDAR